MCMSKIENNKCIWIGIGIDVNKNSKFYSDLTLMNGLLKKYENEIIFSENNLPHLNLYDFDIPKNNLEIIIARIGKVISKTKKFSLKIKGVNYFNFGIVFIEFEENSKLIKIHKKIVNSVYSLKGNCTCKDYLDKNRDYDKKQKELLKKYGNPHILSNFKPHITLGLIRGQNLEKIKEYLKKILKIGSFEVNNINIVKEENKNYELIKKFELK